ncbi:hypothetical protein [Streptomyces spectabilis]|uniref:Uncharacterized protein n=1 Tax=Streptomyces spectabilis TaxID=68270 RepID=A0A516RJF1_STRST|nr:hypothetical protein [Streptomyces spectabilis]QDQ15779.1 hypothetical protein FH965_38835 [Streptomyces spectabilis]
MSVPPPPQPYRLLRATDLLDLHFRFLGLRLEKPVLGPRRLVRKEPDKPGHLVVTFGPQHVVEQAFFEISPGLPEAAQDAAPAGSEPHKPPPVASRIGGRSVLVFEVGAQTTVTYTDTGLLTAMRELPLRVVDAAREPAAATGLHHAVTSAPDNVFHALRLARTVAELTARHGADAPVDAGLRAAPAAELAAGARPENPLANPDDPKTGIELPYRLLLSPPQGATWSHSTELADPAGRVELWHTRLPATGTRAVWTRDPGFDPAVPHPLDPTGNDFTMAMTPEDRSSVVHLSSNTQLPGGFRPTPLTGDNLMLSGMGGWLDSLGRWDRPPDGFEVTQWRHRASLGRDHYVRVMYRGRLFPFGHLADLVKVTERKFDHDRPDRAAYLNQKFFIMVREPVRRYGAPGDTEELKRLRRLFPFTSVRLLTLVTPDLHAPRPLPGLAEALEDPPNKRLSFFPETDEEAPFQFQVSMTDLDGRLVEFRTPMAFVGKNLYESRADVEDFVARYTPALTAPSPAPPDLSRDEVKRVVADVRGQAVAYAPSHKPDDTTLSTGQLVWGAANTPASAPAGEPLFLPTVRWARAVVPALSRFGTGSGGDQPQSVFHPEPYVRDAFTDANKGQLFIELVEPFHLTFSGGGQSAGALAQPNFSVAGLSRLTGPVAAAPATSLGPAADPADKWVNLLQGRFNPLDYFKQIADAKLFGMFPLWEILKEVGLDKLKAPNFLTATVNAVTGFLSDLRGLRDTLASVQEQFPETADRVTRVVDTATRFVEVLLAYITSNVEHLPNPTRIEDVDNAFRAFADALRDLRVNLPAGVETGVRQLLTRIAEATATYENGAGEVLALRDAIKMAALGAKLPDVVSSRLQWQPDITPWAPDRKDPPRQEKDAVFWPTGKLTLVADLRGSLRPDVPQAADVTCTLDNFKLRMVPDFEAIALDFERIRFTMRAGKKPDVEVKFRDLEFIGHLQFIQTLRNLIPLDGFSDPPALTVDSSGIHANYSMQLPNAAVGVFSLENLSLNAMLSVPFIGNTPLQAGFSFCRREAPFRLTVSMLGGGGYFGIVLNPKEIAVLDAALEFGAAVSMNFGVASGSLSVMAGVYFRLEVRHIKPDPQRPDFEVTRPSVKLVGYLRARGEVDVLGIISASIELYLELGYEDGYAVGRARLTISIEIGFFSKSVTIRCEKKFAGSGERDGALGAATAPELTPPSFADLMSPYTDPVTGARVDPVLDYCTAFAEVN